MDDESIVFSYHMLAGVLLGFIVFWRIIWGFVGSRHARFSRFDLNPLHLKDYIIGIISGSKKRWTGHNPASSWAAIAMFLLALCLSVSGYLMTTDYKEEVEDLHEFFANAFIILVILHVSGVILHWIRHQDSIALSMIDGKKELPESTEPIKSSGQLAALVFVCLVALITVYLGKNFDTKSRSLNLFGTSLQLGDEPAQESNNYEDKDD